MMTRRELMLMGAGVAIAVSLPAWAVGNITAERATAITQVFGDGIRLTAVAIEFNAEVNVKQFAKDDFSVEGRTITDFFVSQSASITPADSGRFVILSLSVDDPNLSLSSEIPMANATVRPQNPNEKGKRKPWVAGDKPATNLVFSTPTAQVRVNGKQLDTSTVNNLIVDDFQQLTFNDPTTGKTLRYNLYVPKNQSQPLPLVLFMHDAGVTSEFHRATLMQGLGAVIWADPAEQAKRPCFVLAPQYDEVIVDDQSQASPMLDTTIHLIEELVKKYQIDTNRLYATGQSGGCMMSIAMNIKYPDLFAASYLVAGQWSPDLVAPLAKKKLWIMVSMDDLGAFPGENRITERLEKEGAKISRAIWNGTWDSEQYRFAYDKIRAEKSPINYTVFDKETVFLPTSDRKGASGHRNTWRIAYTIEPIREWLFEQVKGEYKR